MNDPNTMLDRLSQNHELASRLSLLVLKAARAGRPAADDIYGLVNINVASFGPIDVWIDCEATDSWLSVHDALVAGRVTFREVAGDGFPPSLVGSIGDDEGLRFFVDDKTRLRLVLATADGIELRAE